MKKIKHLVFIMLLIPCISFAATPDFVTAISTGLSTLTPAQKLQIRDDYCYARGYTDTVRDSENNEIANPVSKTAYMNADIYKLLKIIVINYRKQQAFKAVTVEELPAE